MRTDIIHVQLMEATLTSYFFRDPEASQESLVLQVQSALKGLEDWLVSWVPQDLRETRETWVHLDHL